MFFLRHPFLVFFLFSLSEAVLLAKVGSKIGWGWTILAIVSTAMIGSAMWRQQGLETWRRLNQRMGAGELPGSELIEGVMLIVGGALLITPGFITDTVGFLLLFPVSRKAAAKWLFAKGVLQGLSQQPGGFQQGGFSGVYRAGGFGRSGDKTWVYQQYTSTHRDTGVSQGFAREEPVERVVEADQPGQHKASSKPDGPDDSGAIEGEFIPKDKF